MNDIFGKELNVGDSVVILFGILKDGVVHEYEAGSLFKISNMTQDSNGNTSLWLKRKGRKYTFVTYDNKVVKVV
jgi:hypothetical protein